jgi:hypothetical protein
MRVAITGSHGLIGSALTARLRADGHRVLPLVRGTPADGEIRWDPQEKIFADQALVGIDAVVHLAGAGVGDHRWSERHKQEILASRVKATALLSGAIAALPEPPAVMLSASAVGYYGIRGDEVLTEDSEPGSGFLAGVCKQWEAATVSAESAGVRVIHLRTGVVLSAAGGALKKQLPLFRAGLGARLGGGRHYLSWITRRDAISAMSFLLQSDFAGAVNISSPQPTLNADFTKALGRAVRRPTVLAVPESALRMVVGREMTAEFFLGSQRCLPQRLNTLGFTFADSALPEALATALADRALVPV